MLFAFSRFRSSRVLFFCQFIETENTPALRASIMRIVYILLYRAELQLWKTFRKQEMLLLEQLEKLERGGWCLQNEAYRWSLVFDFPLEDFFCSRIVKSFLIIRIHLMRLVLLLNSAFCR